MSFLPEGYKAPSGNYMKLVDGENTFRILSSAVVGFEYWNTENKPIRSKTGWRTLPPDIKIEDDGKVSNINHFWAFAVWNYGDKKVQILELTQKTIMAPIKSLVNNPKWGDPKEYDIVVTKEKISGKVSYTTMADPKTPLDPEIAKAYSEQNLNLEALFDGTDPFMASGMVSKEQAAKEMATVNPEDIGF